MAAQLQPESDLLDRLPHDQRALLLALQAHGGPARARELANAAHTDRRAAGQRLEALAHAGLIIHRDGTGPLVKDRVRIYELSDLGRRLLEHRGAEPGPGATIHSTVLADRVRPSDARAREEIDRALALAADRIYAWASSELTRVYVAGVRDGFAQGVAAEAGTRAAEEASRAA